MRCARNHDIAIAFEPLVQVDSVKVSVCEISVKEKKDFEVMASLAGFYVRMPFIACQ